jgi:hypothetical protein
VGDTADLAAEAEQMAGTGLAGIAALVAGTGQAGDTDLAEDTADNLKVAGDVAGTDGAEAAPSWAGTPR